MARGIGKDQARLPPKGILHYEEALRWLRLRRSAPAIDLSDLVECHWEVAWDLPEGAVHRQRNLSHASVTLAWESDGAWVYGVPGRVFAREVSGRGRAFGTKLRPGAAGALLPQVILADLSDVRVPLADLVGPSAALAIPLGDEVSFEDRSDLSDGFCRRLRGTREAPLSVGLVAGIESDRDLLRVEDLAERASLTVRALQRLFRQEVGLTPKETIRRFRLQQAADRLHSDPDLPLLSLALDLGYFDQAHFARDFRAVVGLSPDAYRKRHRSTGS